MKSSYVISNDVRGRHHESCIVQHDVSMSHMESRSVWNRTFWNEVEGYMKWKNSLGHNTAGPIGSPGMGLRSRRGSTWRLATGCPGSGKAYRCLRLHMQTIDLQQIVERKRRSLGVGCYSPRQTPLRCRSAGLYPHTSGDRPPA